MIIGWLIKVILGNEYAIAYLYVSWGVLLQHLFTKPKKKIVFCDSESVDVHPENIAEGSIDCWHTQHFFFSLNFEL